jgi:hypothetical protein
MLNHTKQKDRPKAALELQTCPRREVAATPDLFRPDRRIAARAAGWSNDRHIARLRRWCANFRVNSCGRTEHAVGSRQFVAQRLRSRVGGRDALRRAGALLRHRLRRRATRCIPRGRWRSRLSRWRRWRRRSLRACRAGCHQSCQDQKKRLSLHGEQMLPRYRCSLLAEKPTDRAIGSTLIAIKWLVGTIDQDPAHAGVAHLSEGDLLRAAYGGHAPLKRSEADQCNCSKSERVRRRAIRINML